MAMPLENPADQLSTIVIRLFQLAGDTRIQPKSKRDRIFVTAHKLHGYSMALAQKQFTENSATYQGAMTKIKEVNSGLKQAKTDIEKAVTAIKDLAKLVSAVEKLVAAAAAAAA